MIDKIAVIGAGTMGSGIAQVAAAAGHGVTVIDRDPDALEKGRRGLAASLDAMIKKGRMARAEADRIAQRMLWSTNLADAAGSRVGIEAVVERLDVKRALFEALSEIVDADAVLASNTSSLSISAMARGLTNPLRFVGLHFFNPVPAMKLVEVVAGEATDAAVIEEMSLLMRSWGKHAVSVRDVPGFIVNRVARPFYAEAFLALEEGIEPQLVDSAMTGGAGFRMGPLALADMIGLDVNYAAASSVFERMGSSARFRPQKRQAELVESGFLGRKSGRGVFDYNAEQGLREITVGVPATDIRISGEGRQFLWLVDVVPSLPSDTLAADTMSVDGVVMTFGDGRPLSCRSDVDVIFDHLHNPVTSPFLIVTARNDAAENAVAGLAAILNKRVILIPDRPGQIVLRTMAQLANGAADAVLDDIAPAAAIDEAMVFGANYPQGPLAWAADYGPARIVAALEHISASTGDAIYAPSKGLDRL